MNLTEYVLWWYRLDPLDRLRFVVLMVLLVCMLGVVAYLDV